MPRTETHRVTEDILVIVMLQPRAMCIYLAPLLYSSIKTLYLFFHFSVTEWHSDIKLAGLPVVLKFLKFHRCPEIRNCPEILLIWSECPEIDLCYAVITALPLFCTLYLFNWTLSVLLAYLLTTILPYVHYSIIHSL